MAQQGRTVSFAIAAGPLPGVLAAYGQATGFQVLYPSDIAQGVSSPGVTGTLAPQDALIRLLAGTGLIARFVDPDTVTLEKLPVQAGGGGGARPGDRSGRAVQRPRPQRGNRVLHHRNDQQRHQAEPVPARDAAVGQRDDPPAHGGPGPERDPRRP
nr:STN domain-containing protein [Azospirillum brasilense]